MSRKRALIFLQLTTHDSPLTASPRHRRPRVAALQAADQRLQEDPVESQLAGRRGLLQERRADLQDGHVGVGRDGRLALGALDVAGLAEAAARLQSTDSPAVAADAALPGDNHVEAVVYRAFLDDFLARAVVMPAARAQHLPDFRRGELVEEAQLAQQRKVLLAVDLVGLVTQLGVQPGQYLDLGSLESSVDRIYSLDLFESVTYDLVENSAGEKGLLISANARRWGPNYLQFGLELSNDFSGNSDFKIGAGYTRNALNSLGGELRVIASMGREDELRFDFYQPVDLGANWFINPQIDWKRRNYGLWIDDRRLAEYEVSGWNLEFGVGRNFRTTDQVRLDFRYGRARPELITGTSLPGIDGRIDIGEFLLGYRHDSLDSLYFPTSGMAHDLSYRFADDMLGANADYQQIGGTGTLSGSWGKNTVSLNYMLGYSFDDDAPLERWYQMGGFGRLSGLAPDQLSGRHAALATLALYRRLNEVEFLPAYAGVTLEAGNVWNFRSEVDVDDLRYSASAFIGAESPIGPLYFAVGHNDGGDTAVYFYVGHPFRGSQID